MSGLKPLPAVSIAAAGEPHPLIAADEPPVVEVLNAEASAPILLVCDHASNRIPRALAGLGLEAEALHRHIAYDIGAAALTRLLAARLEACAVLTGYSRLVIDVNRQPGDPQSILAVSDGTAVPGNANLSLAEQETRTEIFHWPYHHAIDAAFARLRRVGPEPILFSIHTFTPSLAGLDRIWDLGVLWNRDPRLAVPLIEILSRQRDLCVGDNEPYSGRDIAYTVNLHAGSAGLANAAIEVRQDHCEKEDELRRWAEMLGDALKTIMRMPNLHTVEHF